MRKEYSAGAVKHSFWFLEFRKMITLLLDGNSIDTIKQMNIDENIFSAPTVERAKQIFNTTSSRVRSLDESFYAYFHNADISTQKIIVLISIMNTDTLFFNFIYEVYQEKLILGSQELSDSDIRVFFKNKQVQSTRVAGWQDITLKQLGSNYKTFLAEAGMINRSSTDVKIGRLVNQIKLVKPVQIMKPVLDASLNRCLIDNGMEQFVYALTGVRC